MGAFDAGSASSRMKIVHSEDLESKAGGTCTVVMEESDDLWVLYNLVDPDDTVRCGTLRKVTKSDRSGGKVASEKRRVTLSLRAISSEYDGIAEGDNEGYEATTQRQK